MKLRRQKKLKRRIMHVQGPNFVWSTDGYDKLRHWGFYIHGCIDAYSRYIIWLYVGTTNKRSQLILKYYIDAIKELKGIICKYMQIFGIFTHIIISSFLKH